MSDFLLQVVHRRSGKLVAWDPGGPVEVDLVEDLSRRLLKKRVGAFTTRAQVVQVVEETLKELIMELKEKT